MTLHHVAQRAGIFVVLGATFHAQIFRHRDLHALDVITIPEILEHRIRKSEDHHVLNGLLAQIMIDAVYLLFREVRVHHVAQRARTREIVTKRFFDHQSRAVRGLRQTGITETGDRSRKALRWQRDVEHAHRERTVLRFECRDTVAQFFVVVRSAVAGRLPVKKLRRPRGHIGRRRNLFANRTRTDVAERRVIEVGFARETEYHAPGFRRALRVQLIERRHDLASGEVARGAENHEQRQTGCAVAHVAGSVLMA